MELTTAQTPSENKRHIENIDFFGPKKRVARSAEVFGNDLKNIGKLIKSGIALKLFTKQVSLRLFTQIVKNNPVRTGYSRINWVLDESPTVNGPLEQVEGKQYSRPLTGDVNLINAYTYYIKNPLAYIPALESGWSKQAPTGFIANAIFFVSKQLRALK